MAERLDRMMLPELDLIMDFAIKYHAEDELFLIFDHVINQHPFPMNFAIRWIEQYPVLIFTLLKSYPPNDEMELPPELEPFAHLIVRQIIRSANETRIASLVALEKIAKTIGSLALNHYIELLMLAALSVRGNTLVQEVLLILNEKRVEHHTVSPKNEYGRLHALGVAFERAEEAAEECPCNEDGRPRRKMRVPPSHAKLKFGPDYSHKWEVIATVRIDARSAIRLHSHVRLQAASRSENRIIDIPIMDGLVVQAGKGEMKINLIHPAPAEMEEMDWNMYDCGTTCT